MDVTEQYKDLADKLRSNFPLKAFPIRELAHVFIGKGQLITLKTELTITDILNSGEIPGIMCGVQNNYEIVMLVH